MHKERIFSASSGSHRGTSSGNMKPCPLRRCVVFSCPLLIFPALPPFPVLRSQAPPRGGGRTGHSLFLWNARARARRAERPHCFRAARPVLGRAGPSRVADPVCLPAVLPGVAFVFPFRPPRPVSASLFLLRLAEPSAGSFCRTPCSVLRRGPPAACPGIFLSRLSVVSSPRRFLSLLLRASPHTRHGVAFGLSSVLAPLSCFSPSAGSRGGPGA